MEAVFLSLRSATIVALRGMLRAGVFLTVVLAGLAMTGIGLGPRTGAYQTLTVLTGSMHPEIPAGSLVVVRPVAASAIRPGDIVTINAPIPGAPVVTHRVTEIVEAGSSPVIRTKGDANTHPDPWLARIEGGRVWKVAMTVPHAGAAVSRLRSPAMRPILLYAIPGLIAMVWLAEIWGVGRRRQPCAVRPRRGGMPRVAGTLARGIHAHP